MIIVKNRKLLIPNDDRYLGTNYDNNSANRQFKIERYTQNEIDLSGLNFKADMKYENNIFDTIDVSKEVMENSITLMLIFPTSTMSHAGTMLLSLRAYSDDGVVKWSSFWGAFYIEPRDAAEASEEQLSELEKLEVRINRAIAGSDQKVQEAIDKVTNRTDVVLSGVSAILEQKIREAVSAWIAEHGDDIRIDKTFSMEGAAADAKETGIKLQDLRNRKVDCEGGESGDTVVTLPSTDSGITSLPSALGKIISGSRLGKALANLKAGLGYVLHVGQLVNNTASDSTDLPLAAAVGKNLQTQLNQLNAKTIPQTVSSLQDIKTTGCYCGNVFGPWTTIFAVVQQDGAAWCIGVDNSIATINPNRVYIAAKTSESGAWQTGKIG